MTASDFSASRSGRQTQLPLKQLACAVALLLHANHPMAEGRSQTFNIPPQSLSSALNAYADAANVQLSYPAALAEGKGSSGLSGQYTPEQALRKLLGGSLIITRTTDNGTVTLEKAAPSAPAATTSSQTTLPTVKVSGTGLYDSSDPYNPDYILPSASGGTKTDTPVVETPLNVQTIAKQVLKDQQVISLDQALKNVSGITTNGSGGNEGGFFGGTGQSVILRGFESQTYFRDGFRLQQGISSREMANVESVEVIKGPAAILYGLVDPGGIDEATLKRTPNLKNPERVCFKYELIPNGFIR